MEDFVLEASTARGDDGISAERDTSGGRFDGRKGSIKVTEGEMVNE
jgi:hypothetical protein